MASRDDRGFTLVEVLVVMAVMTVLASILFPVFAAARRRSRSASCQANLRQIYMAFELYLQDYDDHYPNNGDPFLWMGRKWRWPLRDYLQLAARQVPGDPMKSTHQGANVLLCPDDNAPPAQYDSTSYAYSLAFYHDPDQINAMTTIQQTWTDKPACVSHTKSDVQYPSDKALITEWTSNHEMPCVAWNSWEGGRNYLFADGHCVYLKAKRINPANDGFPDINLTHNGIRGKDID
jgi:prepilin-type N-terminal cleavage/methylation domain-containing protein/prepilin-type processing-associated H-X9-DG protein